MRPAESPTNDRQGAEIEPEIVPEAVAYEASPSSYPFARPSRDHHHRLNEARVTQLSTLCVPPKPSTVGREMMWKLGLAPGE